MEPITVIIGGAVLLVSAVTAAAMKCYAAVKDKNKQISSLQTALASYTQTYQFEEVDNQLISNCKDYLQKKFGDDIVGRYAQLSTVEDKEQFTKVVVNGLAKEMGVDVKDIKFEDLSPCMRGYAQPRQDSIGIVINRAVLLSDPEQTVKTICHELRHCLQFCSLVDNKHGYSDARLAQWLYSWEHYQSCETEADYSGYVAQVIELDANLFANSVFKALNS